MKRIIPLDYPVNLTNRLIWINPKTVTFMIVSNEKSKFGRKYSGSIRKGDWDSQLQIPISLHPKSRYSYLHWAKKQSWEQSGAFEYHIEMIAKSKSGIFDKCRTHNDVRARLIQLDQIFECVRKSRTLKTRFDLGLVQDENKETGGIYVHFDRYAKPVFGLGGFHRLLIAQILGLDIIPVEIGVIHDEALPKISELCSNFKARKLD